MHSFRRGRYAITTAIHILKRDRHTHNQTRLDRTYTHTQNNFYFEKKKATNPQQPELCNSACATSDGQNRRIPTRRCHDGKSRKSVTSQPKTWRENSGDASAGSCAIRRCTFMQAMNRSKAKVVESIHRDRGSGSSFDSTVSGSGLIASFIGPVKRRRFETLTTSVFAFPHDAISMWMKSGEVNKNLYTLQWKYTSARFRFCRFVFRLKPLYFYCTFTGWSTSIFQLNNILNYIYIL